MGGGEVGVGVPFTGWLLSSHARSSDTHGGPTGPDFRKWCLDSEMGLGIDMAIDVENYILYELVILRQTLAKKG